MSLVNAPGALSEQIACPFWYRTPSDTTERTSATLESSVATRAQPWP